MKLAITGSPGVGKTSVGKALAKHYSLKFWNEKDFGLKKGIGEWDDEENELVVDERDLEKTLNKEISREKGILVEGHLICETKLKVDYLILLRCDPELLELRLEKRGYKAEKVQDNVFCEGIDYCKKHAERNYPKGKIIEVNSGKTLKETMGLIITELEKRLAQ